MDELFNLLSSSARIDKSKRKKKKKEEEETHHQRQSAGGEAPTSARGGSIGGDGAELHPPNYEYDDADSSSDSDSDSDSSEPRSSEKKKPSRKQLKSRDRTAKRDTTPAKLHQIHVEQISAFRRRLGIRLSTHNKHDATVPDPIASFDDIRTEQQVPSWMVNATTASGGRTEFDRIVGAILRNVEGGKWVDPTPIQMQAIPALLGRRDVMGCAPTGSGKSGAFVLPALVLSGLGEGSFYGTGASDKSKDNDEGDKGGKKAKGKKGKGGTNKNQKSTTTTAVDQTGQIRSLLLAPSRELATQLHREVERLGEGKPGGLRCALLSKHNSSLICSNKAGGKRGLDVLISTPLRLVECLGRGLDLGTVRLVVLDEADRLLDCTDGGLSVAGASAVKKGKGGESDSEDSDDDSYDDDESSSSDEEEEDDRRKGKKGKAKKKKVKKTKRGPSSSDQSHEQQQQQQLPSQSGSSHAKTFLEQIDTILSAVPATATRALFSATLGPAVRHLSESVLRNPVDVTTGRPGGSSSAAAAASSPAANSDIDQSLMFVGREEGKLLAIRQLIQRGIKPPVIIFLQSKDRAQALFGELLYDGVNVDVIHAGRSQAARDGAVSKFRRGETWILICTDLVARGVDFKAVNMVINYDLPTSGVTYVHRIGRTGRAGRKGTAVTLFTEADFGSIRPIANVMKLSGCKVPEWILTLKKAGKHHSGTKERMKAERNVPKRSAIDTTPGYDKTKRQKKKQSIENSLNQKLKEKKKEKKKSENR